MICESEGVSITKLKWKRQTNKGDVSVPDNKVTIVRDWANNRVSATLRITNAQPQDSGVYKCVLMAFDKTDYKLTRILVKGTLNTYSFAKLVYFTLKFVFNHEGDIYTSDTSEHVKHCKKLTFFTFAF